MPCRTEKQLIGHIFESIALLYIARSKAEKDLPLAEIDMMAARNDARKCSKIANEPERHECFCEASDAFKKAEARKKKARIDYTVYDNSINSERQNLRTAVLNYFACMKKCP